jgi:hypothetical protein
LLEARASQAVGAQQRFVFASPDFGLRNQGNTPLKPDLSFKFGQSFYG